MRSKKDAEPRLQTERDWTAYHKTGAGRQTDRQDRQDRQRDREREREMPRTSKGAVESLRVFQVFRKG